MKTSLTLLSIPVVLLLHSCNSKQSENSSSLFNNDFETLGYWSESPRVIREAAHSGSFCSYTDTASLYSQTMVIRGKDIKNKEIKSLKASAWVMSNQTDAKAKLVLSIEKDGKNIFWEGIETQRNMRAPNKWVDVSLKIDLKEKLGDDMVIKLYGLNDGQRRVYWDDFTFTTE